MFKNLETKEAKKEAWDCFWAMFTILGTTFIIMVGVVIFEEVFLEPPAKKQMELRDSLLIENYKLRNEILKKQLNK